MQSVAVLFGGKSCENEISVLTGVFVLNLLDREKYTPLPVYLHTDGNTYYSEQMTNLDIFKKGDFSRAQRVFFENGRLYAFLPKKNRVKEIAKIDVALNCCHGGWGEGGGMAALMERNGIPFASPDIASSAVFMDKSLTKTVMRGLGVPTVDCIRANEKDYEKRGAFLLKSIAARLKYPVVVKPAHLGSSIGIALAQNEEEAKRAIENAFALDDRVIIEKYLKDKRDVNCAAYLRNGEICVSEAEEAYGAGIYSFEDKYVNRETGVKSSGRRAVSGELREKIRAYTKTVYKRMNLKGIVRMDFLVHEDKAYLCEVNTVPGSLAYYLFCERICEARTLFSELIDEALETASANGKQIPTTGILKTVKWSRK